MILVELFTKSMRDSLSRFCLGLVLVATMTSCLFAGGGGSSFGFKRKMDPRWFPNDARQWEGFDESILLTDLSRVEPQDALTTGRRVKDKWKVLDYATEEFSGKALSVYFENEAPPVSLPIDVKGPYAVYLGVCTVSGGLSVPRQSAIKVKLGSRKVYRHMANQMKMIEPRRDVIQEIFLAVEDFQSPDMVDIAQMPDLPGTVNYVRLVPLSLVEYSAWKEDLANEEFRTSILTFDGHSWIWPYKPRTAEDLEANFEGLQYTDADQWWFQMLGTDLVCYPSERATIPGADTAVFSRPADRAFSESMDALIKNGVNPLVVARNCAKKQGREFHVMARVQGWGASIPLEETFNSRFYHDHPEWRCIDREGKRTMHMSYAVPEVRQRVIDNLLEAVGMCDPDGVGFLFFRGMPLMLWEPAFRERFKKEYGADVLTIGREDSRVLKVRGMIMNEFLEELRSALDKAGAAIGKRYSICAATFSLEKFNKRFGLDIPTWIEKGLVDELAPAYMAYYTKYAKPDMAYYRRLVEGTRVEIRPFIVAWNLPNPTDLCNEVLKYRSEGASGIAIWDLQTEKGFAGGEGNFIDFGGYLGHTELIEYWANFGVPVPNNYPLVQLDENEYSAWYPNTGY